MGVPASTLHVRELGAGPPVVLLHPGPGLDGSVFLPGAELLAQTHRVLLVDLPGNGRSEDGDRNEWSFAGFARAVERLAAGRARGSAVRPHTGAARARGRGRGARAGRRHARGAARRVAAAGAAARRR